MSESNNNNPNKLLRALSPEAYTKISKHLAPISLPHRYRIANPKVICAEIVFLNSGVASVINVTKGLWQEVGLFGNEGVACISSMLSGKAMRNLIVMQVPGTGQRIRANVLREIFDADDEIRELLLCYVDAFISQLTHTAMANVQCSAIERLARWLLMINDRSEADALPLTHEYIAAMLGVARPSITLSLNALKETGAISLSRKLIKIESRSRLLELAAEFYGGAEKDYEQIMAARRHTTLNQVGEIHLR